MAFRRKRTVIERLEQVNSKKKGLENELEELIDGEEEELTDIYNCVIEACRHEEAIEYGLKLWKLYQESDDKSRGQVICYNLGVHYAKIGQYNIAMEWSLKSLKMAQELGNKVQEALTLQDIAVCLENAGKLKTAIQYDLKSLKVYQELNDQAGEQILCRVLGFHYQKTGQLEEALTWYYKSLMMAQELKNKLQEAVTLQDIAVCLENSGNLKEAIEYDLKSLKVYQVLNDKAGEQVLCRTFGLHYQKTGQFVKALAWYNKSLKMAQEQGNEVQEAMTLQDIAVCLGHAGKPEEAIEYDLSSLNLYQVLDDKAGEQSLCRNLGIHYQKTGQFDEALEWYHKSVKMAQELKNKVQEAATLQDISVCLSKSGKPEEAVNYDLMSLMLYQALNDKVNEQAVCRNLGIHFEEAGLYERASKWSRKSLKMAQELENTVQEATTLQDIGVCLSNAGRPKEAIKYDLRSLKLYQALNDKVKEQALCRNLGIHYEEAGQYETALQWHHKSSKMAQELENKVQEAKTLQDIGVCLEHAGRFREAAEFDLRSLKLYRTLKDEANEQTLCRNLGIIYLKISQFETAVHYYNKSLEFAQKLGVKENQHLLYRDLEKMYREIGETERALECYKKAMRIAPLLKDEDRNRSTLVLNPKHSFHPKRTKAADDRENQTTEMGSEEDNSTGLLDEKIVAAVAARVEKCGKRRNNRMSVFFIGQDRVGKTSLKKSLLGETFNDQQSSTVGIDIDVVEVDEGNKSKPWRFAQDQELLASEARISRAVVEEAAKMLIDGDDDDGGDRTTNNGGDGDSVVAVDGAALRDGVAASAKGDANVIVVDHSGSGNGGRRGDDGHDGDNSGNSIRGVSVQGDDADVNVSISTDVGEGNEIGDSGIYDDGFSGGSGGVDGVRNDLPQHDWSEKINPALEDEALRESINTARVPLTDELIKIIVEEVAAVKQYSDDVDKIRMMLADVSGQSVFYDLHSLFLAPHSICLLAIDLNKPLHGKAEPLFVNAEKGIQIPLENYLVETNLDYANRWMALLDDLEKTHEGTTRKSSGENGKVSRLPRTILVLTKPDQLSGTPAEVNTQIKDAKSVILESFTSHGYRSLIVKTCVIDNTKSQSFPQGGELEELRGVIFDTAQEILKTQETIPIPLLQFERALGTLMKSKPYITVEEAQHLGKELKVNKEQVTEALTFLHQQNIIVHFDGEESESNLVVLDPRWLVKLFTKVITVPPPDKQMGDQAKLWQDLTKRGVLSSKLLDVVLKDHGNNKKALLKLMERSHLMCHWKGDKYLVPSMVKPRKKKEDVKQFLSNRLLVPSLFIDFKAKYVPMGFFTRLQSEFILWSKRSNNKMPELACNISRFSQVEGNIPFSVVLVQHISRIQIALIKEDAHVTQEKMAEIPRKVKSFLVNAIKSIEKAHPLYRNMEYDLAVKCGLCRDEEIECDRHNKESCDDDDCVHLLFLDELKEDPVGNFCDKVVFSRTSLFDISKVLCWMDKTDKVSEELEMLQLLNQIDVAIQWWCARKDSSRDNLRNKLEMMGREDVIRLLDRRTAIHASTLIRDLNLETRHQICEKLDVENRLGGDYRDLARKTGVGLDRIELLSRMESPSKELLRFWETRNEATVEKFVQLLRSIGRDDVVDTLDKALESDLREKAVSKVGTSDTVDVDVDVVGVDNEKCKPGRFTDEQEPLPSGAITKMPTSIDTKEGAVVKQFSDDVDKKTTKMEETQPKDLAKEAEITTSSKARSSPDELSSNSGCRDVNGEDVNARTSNDWFFKTFIDPCTFFIKEDAKDKLLQFKWLTGSFGLTGPNRKVKRGHLFLTVKKGYKRKDVLHELSDEFGFEVTQYIELLKEKKAPKFKFLSSPQTTSPKNSPECGCGISFVEPSGDAQSSCVNQGDGINPSGVSGTLMIFGSACDNLRCHHALTCYHVAACNDAFIVFDKHNLEEVDALTNDANSEYSPTRLRHFYWHRTESVCYSSGSDEYDGENISESGSSSLGSADVDGNNNDDRAQKLGVFAEGYFQKDCDIFVVKLESDLQPNCQSKVAKPATLQMILNLRRQNWESNKTFAVQKFGYTTGRTGGNLRKCCFDYCVEKNGKNTLVFSNAYVVQGSDPPFMEGGDSGALVMFEHTDKECYGFAYGVCEVDDVLNLPSDYNEDDDEEDGDEEDDDEEDDDEEDDDENEEDDDEEDDDEEDGIVFQHDPVNDSKFICFDLAVAFEKLKLVKKPCFGACVKGESEEEGREEE